MTEIRWTNGKEEYDRDEVYYMLETQRAMIYNDMKKYFIKEAESKGLKGKLTEDANNALEALVKWRRVVF